MRLLESSARRQPRRAGMFVSVVAHTAVIALAVVATASGDPVPDELPREALVYSAPPPAPTAPRSVASRSSTAPAAPGTAPTLPTPDLSRIPDVIPPPGPPLDPGLDPSRGLFGPAGALADAVGTGLGSGTVDTGSPLSAGEVERQVLLVGAPPRPRYPETLRAAGVEGRVVLRFVVDTAGRVERGSVAVASSSHPLFAAAVEPIVATLRFRPAEAAGRRVRQLVEMPFEFVLGGPR